MRWRCSFKEFSQDEGRMDFSKNLSASLFNKYLSNEPYFSRKVLLQVIILDDDILVWC
jgi:hypothetical protein